MEGMVGASRSSSMARLRLPLLLPAASRLVICSVLLPLAGRSLLATEIDQMPSLLATADPMPMPPQRASTVEPASALPFS